MRIAVVLVLGLRMVGAANAGPADVLPMRARALLTQRPDRDGPNCLNAVELYHGLARAQRWTAWRVLDRKLRTANRFREMRANELSQLGDVILYRHGPLDLIEHGAIFVDSLHVWEKANADATSTWQFTSHEASAAPYGYTIVQRWRRLDARRQRPDLDGKQLLPTGP